MQTLNGRLDFSVLRSTPEGDCTAVVVYDDNTSLVLFTIQMTPQNFLEALNRRGHVPCRIEMNDFATARVGHWRQVATARIAVPQDLTYRSYKRDEESPLWHDPMVAPQVREWIDAGWDPRYEDFTNMHRYGDTFTLADIPMRVVNVAMIGFPAEGETLPEPVSVCPAPVETVHAKTKTRTRTRR